MANCYGQTSRETVSRAKEEERQREKAIIKRLMAEKREVFSEEHPKDRGNGYYERTTLTPPGPDL